MLVKCLDKVGSIGFAAVVDDTTDGQREDVKSLELATNNLRDQLGDDHGEMYLTDFGRNALDTLDCVGLDLHRVILQVPDKGRADLLFKRLLELVSTLVDLVAEVESTCVAHILVIVLTVLEHFAEVSLSLACCVVLSVHFYL